MTVGERVLILLAERPGLTGRGVAEAMFGPGALQPRANGVLQALEQAGRVVRRQEGSVLRCYLAGGALPEIAPSEAVAAMFGEDQIKAILQEWLSGQGYTVQVAMGRERGIDIDAFRDRDRWIIEVKGPGSLSAMRVNYFLSMLGETLQRMNDPAARYSIALPDMPQYRGLWNRLPLLAKQRTGISCLFVRVDGVIDHVD